MGCRVCEGNDKEHCEHCGVKPTKLQQFKRAMQDLAYGPKSQPKRDKGLCIDCGEPAIPKCYSAAGRKEYAISGLCEVCYDNMFK